MYEPVKDMAICPISVCYSPRPSMQFRSLNMVREPRVLGKFHLLLESQSLEP
jgi:hypothetical protein